MTKRSARSLKARPRWHSETCSICQATFDELSDPAVSLHLCTKCMHTIWGVPLRDTPLQKSVAADNWWHNFVYAYERDLALGLIDQNGKEIK